MSKNKFDKVVGTRHILSAVWSEIDRAKGALLKHYADYGTDVSKYDKSVKEMHETRVQEMADSLKAQVTLDNIEEKFDLEWKKDKVGHKQDSLYSEGVINLMEIIMSGDSLSSVRWLEIYEVAKRLGIRRDQEIEKQIGADVWHESVDFWRERLSLSGEDEREFFNDTISGWQNKMREERD